MCLQTLGYLCRHMLDGRTENRGVEDVEVTSSKTSFFPGASCSPSLALLPKVMRAHTAGGMLGKCTGHLIAPGHVIRATSNLARGYLLLFSFLFCRFFLLLSLTSKKK